VQVNLAYRWFCKLGIEDAVPDHSAFSRARKRVFSRGGCFSPRVAQERTQPAAENHLILNILSVLLPV
jgi:transposase